MQQHSNTSSLNSNSPTLSNAQQLLRAGISILPIRADESKAPAVRSWKEYQQRRFEESEVREWFGPNATARGIGTITGAISGNLEALDFDDPAVYPEFTQFVELVQPGLLEKMIVVKTPSEGYHLIYRCEGPVEGNQKLAQRKDEDGKVHVRIETRGEGGYVVSPFSPLSCHPLKKPYKLIRGNYEGIPVITAEQRKELLDCARTFNQVFDEPSQTPAAKSEKSATGRPGDEYNQRGDWSPLFEAGWEKVGKNDRGDLLRKPGASGKGHHATLTDERFYCFSTSAYPFEAERAYDKFSVYALLKHGGDFGAAAKQLAADGFGEGAGKEGKEGNDITDGAAKRPAEEDWPEPEAIAKTTLHPVSSLTPELVPEPLRTFVLDVAERMQAPREGIAIAVIVTIASIIGSGCRIRPKQFDDWTVTPNLWGVLIAPPGSMKTSILDASAHELLAPLIDLAEKDFENASRTYQADVAGHKASESAISEQMKKVARTPLGNHAKNMQELKADYALLKQPEKPRERRYSTQASTVEKLHELCSETPRGVMVLVDELTRLLKSWQKQGHECDRSFYLEGWSGGRSFSWDTIGRGTVHTPSLTLSVLGSTQPDRILDLINSAATGGDNDGCVQRFQLAVYPDPFPWKYVDRSPDEKAKARAHAVVHRLALTDFKTVGLKQDGNGNPFVHFSPEAQEVFVQWLTDLETNKLTVTDHPLIIEHLAKFRSLMPSLALIFQLIEAADQKAQVQVVSEDNAQLAAAWCRFLEEHARRIYGLIENAAALAVVTLGAKIKAGAIATNFTPRDVYFRDWKHLQNTDTVHAACKALVERHWLRENHCPAGPRGGQPTTRYLINPKVLAE